MSVGGRAQRGRMIHPIEIERNLSVTKNVHARYAAREYKRIVLFWQFK